MGVGYYLDTLGIFDRRVLVIISAWISIISLEVVSTSNNNFASGASEKIIAPPPIIA